MTTTDPQRNEGNNNNNDDESTTTPSIRQRINDLPRDCINCDFCDRPNPPKRCSACQAVSVYYCSRDCQKNHWSEHKATCKEVSQWFSIENLGLEGDVLSMLDVDDDKKTALNDNCPICLSMELEHPVMLQNCQHQYCFSCIQAWQKRCRFGQKASRCPYCSIESSSSVEDAAVERAQVLASRAQQLERAVMIATGGEKNKEIVRKKIRQLQEDAIEEVDKVLNSGSKFPHIRAFVTKADICMQNLDTCETVLEFFDQAIPSE